ncbi:Transposon Tn7 transposition protein TnsB [compost metagenome]|uniref:DDE-type integrase/transposase/recombinase n=1 Tax=Pseudomonas TaxID=286 RepID=UPI0004109860|nr:MULTISPECIES: DDE-type integrase/transposase/recombinase [Pseudomonas]MCW2268918.1 putative transposase [Pseudomonas sp. JUb96]PRA73063.1 integrase [Pseudomonas sp. MYb187]
MQTFLLKAKLVVVIHGRTMSLQRRLIDRRLLFIDQYGEPTTLTDREFHLGYERREIEICTDQPYLGEIPCVRNVAPDLSCFPAKHSEEALRRRKYIECVTEGQIKLPKKYDLQEKLTEIAVKIGDATVPSVSTFRRWHTKFVGRNVVKLIPKHADKGRTSVISGELEEILQDVIHEVYLQLERHQVSKVVGEYLKRVDERNVTRLPSDQLNKPCGMTVRRYIARLDPYEVDVRRIGKYAAKKKHRVAREMLVVGGILDRWEIDHTLLDVLLVDEETGLVIGRPYITIVLDKYSRMIMGYLIHLAAPNTETILRVIERSIRPKTELLERFPKVQNEWRAHGVPARLVPDNAAEFHADDLIAGFNELGIEIMYPRSRGPEMKGSVERFFRTQNLGLIHNLPGTTFSNTQEKGDYRSEKYACFTLAQLEASVVKWIVDGYHQTPHRSLSKRTPAQVWASEETSRLIKLPVDLDALECILARRSSVKVHHYGIEVCGHGYHSPELAELRMLMAPQEKINVRYRDELGHVWVHDRFRNVFLQVPIKDKRMLGLSRELWKAAEKALQDSGSNSPSFDQVHQCYRDLTQDIAEARRSQKLRKRRAVTRAKIDKDGWRLDGSVKPLIAFSEMDWLDKPSGTANVATSFKVTRRHLSGGLSDE